MLRKLYAYIYMLILKLKFFLWAWQKLTLSEITKVLYKCFSGMKAEEGKGRGGGGDQGHSGGLKIK